MPASVTTTTRCPERRASSSDSVRRGLVGVVVRDDPPAQCHVQGLEQPAQAPGVFRRHHIRGLQLLAKAWGRVRHISDRRGRKHENAGIHVAIFAAQDGT